MIDSHNQRRLLALKQLYQWPRFERTPQRIANRPPHIRHFLDPWEMPNALGASSPTTRSGAISRASAFFP